MERNDFIIEKQRAELFKVGIVNFTGRLFSSEHNRWFATDNTSLQILRDSDKRLTLTANRIPLSQWFNEQYDKLRQSIPTYSAKEEQRDEIVTVMATTLWEQSPL